MPFSTFGGCLKMHFVKRFSCIFFFCRFVRHHTLQAYIHARIHSSISRKNVSGGPAPTRGAAPGGPPVAGVPRPPLRGANCRNTPAWCLSSEWLLIALRAADAGEGFFFSLDAGTLRNVLRYKQVDKK